MEVERRIAPDGEAYTWKEFIDFFLPPADAHAIWAQSCPVPQSSPVGLQPAPAPPRPQASDAPPGEGSAASSAPAPAVLPAPVRPGPQRAMQPPPGYVAAVQPGAQEAAQPAYGGAAPAMRPPPGYWQRAQARLPKSIDAESVRLNVLRCEAQLELAVLTPVPDEDWDSDGAGEAEGDLEAEHLSAMLEKLGDNGSMREILESAPPEIRQLLMMQAKAATAEASDAEVEAGLPAKVHEGDQPEAKGSKDEVRKGAGAPEPSSGGAEDGVRGDWVSDNGGCAIFDDHMTNRLTYEEPVGANRLHGWLDEGGLEDGVQVWRAKLGILEEDENPWYGPSFGEEPEYVGDIQVRMPSSDRMETRIIFMDENGIKDSDWQPPTLWWRKPKPAPRPAVAEGTFVFGQ